MYICRLVQSRVFNSQQCSFSTSGDACILGHEERAWLPRPTDTLVKSAECFFTHFLYKKLSVKSKFKSALETAANLSLPVHLNPLSMWMWAPCLSWSETRSSCAILSCYPVSCVPRRPGPQAHHRQRALNNQSSGCRLGATQNTLALV